eukprot:gene29477-35577_t
MDSHKKRIAELQILREQIAKSKTIPKGPPHEPSNLTPYPNSSSSSHARNPTFKPDLQEYDSSVNGKPRVESKKPANSVHHIALSLLTEKPAKSPPANDVSQPQVKVDKQLDQIKAEPSYESSRKDPVQRKLQSTVRLLSEALEEIGQLKALLELTMDKHLYDRIMDNWDNLNEKFMKDVKIRALEVEKENLLHQVIDTKAALEEEKDKRKRVEAELRATQELLQNVDSELTRTQSSLALRNEASAVPAQSPRSLPPTTPKRSGTIAKAGVGLNLGVGMGLSMLQSSAPGPAPLSPDVSLGRAGDYVMEDEEQLNEDNNEYMENGEELDEEGGLSWLEVEEEEEIAVGSSAVGAKDPRHGDASTASSSRTKLLQKHQNLPTFDDSDVEDADQDDYPTDAAIEHHHTPAAASHSDEPAKAPSPCVLLDVAISDTETDTLVVTSSSDPLQLAVAFIEAWGLGADILPALVNIIEETKDELCRNTGEKPSVNAGKDNKDTSVRNNRDSNRNNQEDRRDTKNTQANTSASQSSAVPMTSSRQSATPSPLQMEQLPTPSPSTNSPSPVIDIDLAEEGSGAVEVEELDELFSPVRKMPAVATGKKVPKTATTTKPNAQTHAQRSTSPIPQPATNTQSDPQLKGRGRRQTMPPPPPLPASPPSSEEDDRAPAWNAEEEEEEQVGGEVFMDQEQEEFGDYEELGRDLAEQHLSPHLKVNMEHIPIHHAHSGDGSPLVRSYCSTPLSVFSYPPDKSLGGHDIEEIISIAADVLQRAQELESEGQVHYAMPLYDSALRLLEVTECSEVEDMRRHVAQNLL